MGVRQEGRIPTAEQLTLVASGSRSCPTRTSVSTVAGFSGCTLTGLEAAAAFPEDSTAKKAGLKNLL